MHTSAPKYNSQLKYGRRQKFDKGDTSKSTQQTRRKTNPNTPDCKQPEAKERTVHYDTWRCANQQNIQHNGDDPPTSSSEGRHLNDNHTAKRTAATTHMTTTPTLADQNPRTNSVVNQSTAATHADDSREGGDFGHDGDDPTRSRGEGGHFGIDITDTTIKRQSHYKTSLCFDTHDNHADPGRRKHLVPTPSESKQQLRPTQTTRVKDAILA